MDKSIPFATRLAMASKIVRPGLMHGTQYSNLWKENMKETTAVERQQKRMFALLSEEYQQFCDEKKRAREAKARRSAPSVAQQRAEIFREDEM